MSGPNKFLARRSAVPGRVPSTVQCEAGAVAINTADEKLYFGTGLAVIEVAKLTTLTAALLSYSKLDGSTPYTAAVAGIDPTAAAHLTTKNYVDAQDALMVRKDGSVAFTAAQSGVAPTLAAHLTTKAYTDAADALMVRKDGSVAFTAAVSGVDPTLAAHLTTKNYVDAADALMVKKDGSVAFTAAVSGVDPTLSTHLATKQYVDALAAGLDVKLSVKAATTANITLSGTQTVDGVALVVGDRVLVKNQSTAANNGIYIVASGSWTRSTDADTSTEVTPGMFTFVEGGSTQAGSGWVLSTSTTIVLGSTSLAFAQFTAGAAYVAGAGLVLAGSTFNIASANGGIVVNADDIALTLADATLSVGAGGLKLAPLASGKVLIGNGSSLATAQSLSGDVTMDNAGVVTVGAKVISGAKIVDNVALGGTAGMTVPGGTTAQRSVTPSNGDQRYNTTLGRMEFYQAGSWSFINSSAVGSGSINQTVVGSIAAATATTIIPYDNTAPLNTEGTQIWSDTITPSNAASRVGLSFTVTADAGQNNKVLIIALFRGTTCIATIMNEIDTASHPKNMTIVFVDTPNTTSTVTYSARMGIDSSGTWYCNQAATAGRSMGGTLLSNYRIDEIA